MTQVIKDQWLREPTQARSRDTLDRILTVGEDLMAAGRFEAVTVAQLVKLAQTSVGAFYARFSDKDALLHVLQERMVQRVERAVEALTAGARWEGRPLTEVVHGLVAGLATIYRLERSSFLGLAAGWRLGARPQVLKRSRRVDATIREGVEVLLQERVDEIAHPQPEVAIRIGLAMVVATLRDHLVFGARGLTSPGTSGEILIPELTAAYLSYLQGGHP